MSGIYIHIPFCKQACHYCNFHFSTSLRLKDEMINAICKEITLRKNYLANNILNSIYFGGGTPSLMNADDLSKIFETINKYFQWSPESEITLEANPDDVDNKKLKIFKTYGINRLSIGIQSFFDADLKWMNRAHNSKEALDSIKVAQGEGFSNISIDLIYGSPITSDDMWKKNIELALESDVPHISSYCLTVEEKTALFHQIQHKKTTAPDPERANIQFDALIKSLTSAGFDHYEISNFAKKHHIAIHNTNYWKGQSYLGIGPSAHSYNGQSRSWNVANNKKYIDSINKEILPIETEFLTPSIRYNEYIMTGLRTMWGVNSDEISVLGDMYRVHFLSNIVKEIDSGLVHICDDQYVLTERGKYFADRIAMNLFFVN